MNAQLTCFARPRAGSRGLDKWLQSIFLDQSRTSLRHSCWFSAFCVCEVKEFLFPQRQWQLVSNVLLRFPTQLQNYCCFRFFVIVKVKMLIDLSLKLVFPFFKDFRRENIWQGEFWNVVPCRPARALALPFLLPVFCSSHAVPNSAYNRPHRAFSSHQMQSCLCRHRHPLACKWACRANSFRLFSKKND